MANPVYERARSVEEATELLGRFGEDAHALAGGQSLMVLVNLGLADPAALVDIDRLPGLSYLRRDGGMLRVGALTRHAEVERWAGGSGGFAVLPHTARGIAYPAIRERGTFAGVLAHADPTGEWCSLVQALDAEIVVEGAGGQRRIAADRFFDGALATSLREAELIVEVSFPHEFAHAHLCKLEPLHQDFPAIVAAAAYDLEEGTVRRARVAVGGAGGAAHRVPVAEALLEGAEASPELFAEAGRAAARGVQARSVDRAAADYCRRVVDALVRRALAGT